ncbi:hypothetical protein DCC79_13095 [bacterium]|nr:MAG: hypothetical protein DCC79_13095 [bacterium]
MTQKPKIAVRNVNVPGHEVRLDAEKYHAMREVLLNVLPAAAPGLTQAEMMAAVLPHLPQALWPDGAKSGWWVKSVQLDLEARGAVVREAGAKPLRWHRA